MQRPTLLLPWITATAVLQERLRLHLTTVDAVALSPTSPSSHVRMVRTMHPWRALQLCPSGTADSPTNRTMVEWASPLPDGFTSSVGQRQLGDNSDANWLVGSERNTLIVAVDTTESRLFRCIAAAS
jgi:hypothetical protein